MTSTLYNCGEAQTVYTNRDLGEIKEGVSFTVAGYILPNCERFAINLVIENETRDIALHVNPRLQQNYILRDTCVKNVWLGPEISSALPFILHRGSKFAIQILITEKCYMISVDGHHLAEFEHRLSYKSVACLEVRGEVGNISFNRTRALEYPERLSESRAKEIRVSLETEDQDKPDTPAELQLPYYGSLPPKGFGSGKRLRIEGRVSLLPQSFHVNLQRGQYVWPRPLIAFHFKPHFVKQVDSTAAHVKISQNVFYNSIWATEELRVSELGTEFYPGERFSLVIVCGMASYDVYLNKKLITEFRFRLDPELVDTVNIEGDIKLWDVVLENLSPFHEGVKKIDPDCQDDNKSKRKNTYLTLNI